MRAATVAGAAPARHFTAGPCAQQQRQPLQPLLQPLRAAALAARPFGSAPGLVLQRSARRISHRAAGGVARAMATPGTDLPAGYDRTWPAAPLKRRAGILLHPTSLPGPYGAGDLGPQALAFVDFLASAGLAVWQAR